MLFIRQKNRGGFTLVELLMVVSMLSIVSLAIFSTFNNGIKIWQKVNRKLDTEEINIFFEKFTRDIRNIFSFSGINFIGTENEVSFPCLAASEKILTDTIGRITYSYDITKRLIIREGQDFSQVTRDEEGVSQRVLGEVSSSKFQYYYYDREKKEYLWLKEWNSKQTPLAVRIEFERINNDSKAEYTKSVFIPVGS